MNYPKWAPADVVELQKEFLKSEIEFSAKTYEKDDLEQYAKDSGFQCWNDLDESESVKCKSIQRLLTQPEMQSFWEWIGEKQILRIDHTANGGLIGTLRRAIDDWYKVHKSATRYRAEEFEEISQHAKALSRLLQKYRGELQPFNSHAVLIPKEYDTQLKRILNQDFIDGFGANQSWRLRSLWRLLLPPVDELIGNLGRASEGSDCNLPGRYPRKIAASNAFRTYLINVMVDWFNLHLLGDSSPTMIATFMSVALDDPGISIDTINKNEEMIRWRNPNNWGNLNEDYE
jgi:hypothetical protein